MFIQYIWCLDAIQLLFTVNLCCWFCTAVHASYCMRSIVVHTFIHSINTYDDGTISNCNVCLTQLPCSQNKNKKCRCRSHRKTKVRTYWHKQSLKRATYSQNNTHNITTQTHIYRKRGQHNDWHVHRVISFLEHCLLTNKRAHNNNNQTDLFVEAHFLNRRSFLSLTDVSDNHIAWWW